MKNKITCPHCHTELPNLNIKQNAKQLWFIVPILLIGFYPLLSMSFFKPVVSEDLSLGQIRTKVVDDELEVIGVITNSSDREWSSVTIEAEFFNQKNEFIDEASEYVRSDITPGAKENFKVIFSSPPAEVLSGEIEPILKISGGVNTDLF